VLKPRTSSIGHDRQLPVRRPQPALLLPPTCATGCPKATWPGSSSTWSTSSTWHPSTERRCTDDIAFRALAANSTPDHVTIARFRVRHEQALARFLRESLKLCAAAGMVRVGPWRWTGPSWPATLPTRPTAPSIGSTARSPRSSARSAEADQREVLSTARRVGTSCPQRWPARPVGWRGCATPRRGWRLTRPNGNAGMSSGSPSWPPRRGRGASSPGAHQAANPRRSAQRQGDRQRHRP
jgi:Transposase domain (DUF772)